MRDRDLRAENKLKEADFSNFTVNWSEELVLRKIWGAREQRKSNCSRLVIFQFDQRTPLEILKDLESSIIHIIW